MTPSSPAFPYRLTNTTLSVDELARCETGILLENALLNTREPLNLPIPESLRAGTAPGAYIVQSRGPANDAFRQLLRQSGAATFSYIPNNAYLVRLPGDAAAKLARSPEVQAVLPYQPYYKLKGALLEAALEPTSPSLARQGEAGAGLSLKLLLFAGAYEETLTALRGLEFVVRGEERSPFGPVVRLVSPSRGLAALAALPGVQEIESAPQRAAATDLTRSAIGVATDSITASNYLGLSGAGVVVNVNDTGVDTNAPDLAGRVAFDAPLSGTDTNGHGTHVAGIIAGSGAQSQTLTNVPGSIMPASPLQFRGMAPAAGIYSVSAGLDAGPDNGDDWLAQTAARTNVLISNNSWLYAGDTSYNLAAASYDAAVRDALPAKPGSQPLLLVFAAGNTGRGGDDGTGGIAGSVQSPATGKNVVTVGAVEHFRRITNETWTCSDGGDPGCVTNAPWLGLTDSTNQVAAFSSRGNVGIGVEGEFGRFKPDVVAPGTFVVSSRSGEWDQALYYAQSNNLFVSSLDANAALVLSNLNRSLGPFYRFESGTSLAAAAASGTLALMQEFFEQRLHQACSPALFKALLINGARSLGGSYDLEVRGPRNSQGWGLIDAPNSIPAALTNGAGSSSSIFVFDQDPAHCLETGQREIRFISVAPSAITLPLRVTLAWTDPPGNPIAGIKLVNDLDLIVTNLDTGDVYFGNDFAPGSEFTHSANGNSMTGSDFVNNVENVYLAPSAGTNFSITVLGRRVNVNAVNSEPDVTAQDYALVISSGDGQVQGALTLDAGPALRRTTPLAVTITNSFLEAATAYGEILQGQRVGASTPAVATNTIALPSMPGGVLTIGSTNQWAFYVFPNDSGFSNLAFLIFSASRLSPLPGLSATNQEADIDLYVSTDAGLTNLDPNVLATADLSAGRGGNEAVAYASATPAVYYIGIKCESQGGAEYGFAALASESPFVQIDPAGNEVIEGVPAPAVIPGGSAAYPGLTSVFGIVSDSFPVRRVIVTNAITSGSGTDLNIALEHNSRAATLSNFGTNGFFTGLPSIYDDSGEGDVPGALTSQGPGSLLDFAGGQAMGQWRLSILDTNQPATNDSLAVFLERQVDLGAGVIADIQPGVCRQDYLYVPYTATNLTAIVNFASGTGPLTMQLCPVGEPAANCLSIPIELVGTNATVVLDQYSHPPLNPGSYVVRIWNLGPDEAQVSIATTTASDLGPPAVKQFGADLHAPIPDDAVSVSTLEVTNPDPILSVEVGVRVSHPRVSDLALSLVGPDGTRVLLDENRGGDSAGGLGGSVFTTDALPVSYTGGPEAITNVIETDQTSGQISIAWDFYSLPDTMHIYYDGQLLFDSGLVSGQGSTNLAYGPGVDTSFTIVMNEGGNLNSNTAWFYSVTTARLQPVFLNFTEDTNLASIPLKFASPPLTNYNYFGSSYVPSNGIYYLPEESLDKFAGKSARGAWTLELRDSRAGATDPPPTLVSWQLSLRFHNSAPAPLPVQAGVATTNILGAHQIQWFALDAPSWVSFATNSLLSATAPVNFLFNPSAPPTGTNAGDFTLLGAAVSGLIVLGTNGAPSFAPGSRWYLGIQNTNAEAVVFALQVDFDVSNVVTLSSGVPVTSTNWGPTGAVDYYGFVVSTNGVRAQFEINGPTSDLALVARKGLPLPGSSRFDYRSDNPYTNDELIVVYDFSQPVLLTPGEWFLGVVNVSGAPAGYSIMATEFPQYGTNIVIQDETLTVSNVCLTWTSLPGAHYYVEGTGAFDDTNWMALSPTITANDIITSYCLGLPSPFAFFRVLEGLVIVPPPLLISEIADGTNGVFLRWTASTNAQFMVEWSPTLAPPAWTSFTNRIVSPTGDFSFLDDGSQSGGLGPVRYYRLNQLP